MASAPRSTKRDDSLARWANDDPTPPRKKRKKPVQLTAKSMVWLRERGFIVDKVERWIPHVKRRKDMFGIIDVVAIQDRAAPAMTVGVQVTSLPHVKDRVAKILKEPNTAILFRAGWKIHVHGWHKLGGQWVNVVTDVGGMPWTK